MSIDIFNDIEKMGEFAEIIEKKFDEMGPVNSLSVVCTMIDYLACRMGCTSVELLESIKPIIEAVNKKEGPYLPYSRKEA